MFLEIILLNKLPLALASGSQEAKNKALAKFKKNKFPLGL
jgi:hypothetical protein